MDRLVNINEISADIRRNRSQLTYVESRIKRLEAKKENLNNEFTHLTSMKRELSKEQYKDSKTRQDLIEKGKGSKSSKAQWIAIRLEAQTIKWEGDIDDTILEDFIELENMVSKRRNYSFINVFEAIGKVGLEGKEGISIENNN